LKNSSGDDPADNQRLLLDDFRLGRCWKIVEWKDDGMAKKTKKPNPKMQAWIEARKRHHLSHAQVHMASELGMNPAKLGKTRTYSEELDPRRQSSSRTEGASDSFDLRNLSTDQATRARISVRRTTGLGQSPITAPIRPDTHGLGRQALIK
jgi:hypothetical protein